MEFPLASPLHNNIAVFFAMVLYYRMAIEFTSWIRTRFKFGESRNVLHMMFSSLVIFWPFFDTSDWSWRLNALVPAVVASRLVYKGALLADPNDVDVQNMTSSLSTSPTNLLFGPLQFAGLMVWLGLYRFMTVEAAIIVAAVGVGDGVAPLIGSRYGRHIFQLPWTSLKTMEGTVVGVFLGTIAGIYTYLVMMGIPVIPLRMVLAYAAIGGVAEATSLSSCDNLVIPVVLHLSIDRVQELLPA